MSILLDRSSGVIRGGFRPLLELCGISSSRASHQRLDASNLPGHICKGWLCRSKGEMAQEFTPVMGLLGIWRGLGLCWSSQKRSWSAHVIAKPTVFMSLLHWCRCACLCTYAKWEPGWWACRSDTWLTEGRTCGLVCTCAKCLTDPYVATLVHFFAILRVGAR